MSELTPQHVLTDLFGSGDFPAEILDPAQAAEIVIQRLLRDHAGRVIPTTIPGASGHPFGAGVSSNPGQ